MSQKSFCRSKFTQACRLSLAACRRLDAWELGSLGEWGFGRTITMRCRCCTRKRRRLFGRRELTKTASSSARRVGKPKEADRQSLRGFWVNHLRKYCWLLVIRLSTSGYAWSGFGRKIISWCPNECRHWRITLLVDQYKARSSLPFSAIPNYSQARHLNAGIKVLACFSHSLTFQLPSKSTFHCFPLSGEVQWKRQGQDTVCS